MALKRLPTGQLSQAARNILYSTDWAETITDFASAVRAKELQENRIFFAHLLADRAFSLAMDMALAYVDDNPVAGVDYYGSD